MEAVPLIANNPIMFRHLELQNLSTILYSIDRAKMVQQFWRSSLVGCVRVVLKHIIYKWSKANPQGPSLATVWVQKTLQQQRRTHKTNRK